MSKAIREGVIISYVPEKGFGFIAGDDGNTYHFKASALTSGVSLGGDERVSFEATATSKGLSAIGVAVIAAPMAMWVDLDHFPVTENSAFIKEGYEVLYEYSIPCYAVAQLHDEVRQKLIEEAKSMGATGLICLRTISVGKLGIQMEGIMVYAQKRGATYSQAEVDASIDRVNKALETAASWDEGYAKYINANPLKSIFAWISGRFLGGRSKGCA